LFLLLFDYLSGSYYGEQTFSTADSRPRHFTSRSTSTPGAFKVITVNALYKLLTYLAYLSGVSIQRNVWNERKKVRNKRNERNSRKKRKLQPIGPELSSFQLN